MKKIFVKKMSFTMIIVICALLGTFLGTGIAYAGVVDHYLSVGTYNYASHHDESVWWCGAEYEYWAKQRVSMSPDKSVVAFSTQNDPGEGIYGSTTYYSGDTNDPYNIRFGPLYISDEYAYHNEYYDDFIYLQIDGCDEFIGTYWYYDNMNSTNNIAYSRQYIWYWDGDTLSSFGSCYNRYITEDD